MATDGRVAIIGLGYVGLPLAIAFAEAGMDLLRRRNIVTHSRDREQGNDPDYDQAQGCWDQFFALDYPSRAPRDSRAVGAGLRRQAFVFNGTGRR